MTYEDFPPYIEKWYTPKITCNNPPPQKYVVSPQHPVKVSRWPNICTFLVFMGLRTPKITAPLSKSKSLSHVFANKDLCIATPDLGKNVTHPGPDS